MLETVRLQKILGLCGSTHDGERLSALTKAMALLEEHGLTWADVIPGPQREQAHRPHKPEQAKPAPEPPRRWQPNTQSDWVLWWRQYWHEFLPLCSAAEKQDLLSEFEADLLKSLLGWRGTPSDKQLLWFSKMVGRLDRIAKQRSA